MKRCTTLKIIRFIFTILYTTAQVHGAGALGRAFPTFQRTAADFLGTARTKITAGGEEITAKAKEIAEQGPISYEKLTAQTRIPLEMPNIAERRTQIKLAEPTSKSPKIEKPAMSSPWYNATQSQDFLGSSLLKRQDVSHLGERRFSTTISAKNVDSSKQIQGLADETVYAPEWLRKTVQQFVDKIGYPRQKVNVELSGTGNWARPFGYSLTRSTPTMGIDAHSTNLDRSLFNYLGAVTHETTHLGQKLKLLLAHNLKPLLRGRIRFHNEIEADTKFPVLTGQTHASARRFARMGAGGESDVHPALPERVASLAKLIRDEYKTKKYFDGITFLLNTVAKARQLQFLEEGARMPRTQELDSLHKVLTSTVEQLNPILKKAKLDILQTEGINQLRHFDFKNPKTNYHIKSRIIYTSQEPLVKSFDSEVAQYADYIIGFETLLKYHVDSKSLTKVKEILKPLREELAAFKKIKLDVTKSVDVDQMIKTLVHEPILPDLASELLFEILVKNFPEKQKYIEAIFPHLSKHNWLTPFIIKEWLLKEWLLNNEHILRDTISKFALDARFDMFKARELAGFAKSVADSDAPNRIAILKFIIDKMPLNISLGIHNLNYLASELAKHSDPQVQAFSQYIKKIVMQYNAKLVMQYGIGISGLFVGANAGVGYFKHKTVLQSQQRPYHQSNPESSVDRAMLKISQTPRETLDEALEALAKKQTEDLTAAQEKADELVKIEQQLDTSASNSQPAPATASQLPSPNATQQTTTAESAQTIGSSESVVPITHSQELKSKE